MRGKIAKKIKRGVFEKLYGEDVSTTDRKAIQKTPKFKEINRAARKRYKANEQSPKLKPTRKELRLAKQQAEFKANG
jgi:hypothetical protein